MNREIINEIKTRMHGFLKKSQMEKLESVLEEILKQQNTAQHGDSKGKKLVELFITAKRIEGCSSRTEEYYLSTLTFFEKNIPAITQNTTAGYTEKSIFVANDLFLLII